MKYGAQSSPLFFNGVRASQSLVLCLLLCKSLLSLCPFLFGHCVACPMIYGSSLPLWYLLIFNVCFLRINYIGLIPIHIKRNCKQILKIKQTNKSSVLGR